ncbi:MAG TPA: hypothetical protein VF815_16655 [Myxococcaceae bacterium]|jgi:hypothetical protein
MPSPVAAIEIAQQILNGRWMYASAALRACQRGEWAGFVREVAQAKPRLGGRRDYERCLALAERSLVGPVLKSLTLVPLWACSTEDGMSTEWVAVHGVAQDGQPLQVQESGPFIDVEDASPRVDALWECTVRRWTAATLVESRFYSPEIPLLLRAGEFGVLELRIDEVLSVDARETGLLPRPVREVPMFASWFEPRVKVSPELESQIRDMCFTAPDNGD